MKQKRLEKLALFTLLAASLTFCMPQDSCRAAAADAATAVQQKAEQAKQRQEENAATQKADALVAAGTLNRMNQGYADVQLTATPVRMTMPKNIQSFWLRIPQGTLLKDGCCLNLDMTVSGTLINDRSSITLEVNGTTLETCWIHSIAQNQTGWWKVEIPSGLLKCGDNANEVKLITAQRSIEGDCADIDNPSNWVRFDPDSYLHLAVSQYGTPSLGNFYSTCYNSIASINGIQNEFILPTAYDASLVGKLLKISSAIGANSPGSGLLNFSVSKGKPQARQIGNKISLGLLASLPKDTVSAVPPGLNNGQGFLSADGSSALITGRDEAGLQKAVNFFANTGYLNQIDQPRLTVDSLVPDAASGFRKNDAGYYTLKDFNYQDISLAGAFHQTATLSLQQPNGVKSGADSYLELKFRHSKALNVDGSLMTVYFNDVARGSVKLNSSNADGGSLKVRIPDEALSREKISVKIDVYNYLGKIDCSKDWYDTAWTVVDKDSPVYFEPGNVGILPTLDSFPLFDVLSSDPAKSIAMIAPGGLDNTDTLALMSMISARAGQNGISAQNYSVYDSSAKITAQDKTGNLIFVGSYEDLRLPAEVTSALAVVPNGGDRFRIENGLSISPETLKNKILFQVVRSPWNFYRKIYVVSYDAGMWEALARFLGDRQLILQLSKQVCVVDGKNRVTAYSAGGSGSASAGKVPLTWERLKYLVEKYTGIPFWVAVGILLLAVLCIVLLIRLIRNKKGFQESAARMQRIIEMQNRDAEDARRKEENRSKDKTD